MSEIPCHDIFSLKGHDCLDVHSSGGSNLTCAVQDSCDTGFSELCLYKFRISNI